MPALNRDNATSNVQLQSHTSKSNIKVWSLQNWMLQINKQTCQYERSCCLYAKYENIIYTRSIVEGWLCFL